MVPRLDRLARSTRELLNTVEAIIGKVGLVPLGYLLHAPRAGVPSYSSISIISTQVVRSTFVLYADHHAGRQLEGCLQTHLPPQRECAGIVPASVSDQDLHHACQVDHAGRRAFPLRGNNAHPAGDHGFIARKATLGGFKQKSARRQRVIIRFIRCLFPARSTA